MSSNSEKLGDPASPDSSGISRRGLIRAAGALGIAATAFRALPASAASGSQVLGSNLDAFLPIESAVHGLSGIRMYSDKYPTQNSNGTWTDHTDSTWPQPIPQGSTTPIPNPGPIVYSIYPYPPQVMDGTLYHTLQGLIINAPPNSYLTTWHEALSLNKVYDKYPFITSDTMYPLHARMNSIVQETNAKYNTSVTYGSIFGGSDSDLGMLFDSVPPNLGFYGQDLYATGGPDCSSGIAAGMQHLEDFINQAAAKDTNTPGYPQLMIPECNYAPDCSLLGDPQDPEDPGDPTLRAQWFGAVCARMHRYGSNSIGVLTFWKDGGSLSGKWDPSAPWGPSTISEMNYIINNIF